MFTQDALFSKSLGNTAFMIIGVPLGMALSLGIALLLHVEVRGVAVWRTFFFLPSIVPAVASSILWIWILNPNVGLMNGGARGVWHTRAELAARRTHEQARLDLDGAVERRRRHDHLAGGS